MTILKSISYLSSYGGAHRVGGFQGQWFQRDRGSSVFKIPVKVSDERVVLRASVTTADTVADRAATSIDTVPELELDVAPLAGSVTPLEMADVAVDERLLFALGAVPAEVLEEECSLGGISCTE